MVIDKVTVSTEAVFDLAYRADKADATNVSYPLWGLLCVGLLCADCNWLSADEKRNFRLVISADFPSRTEFPKMLQLAAASGCGDLLQIEFRGRRIGVGGSAVTSGLMRFFVDHSSTEKWKREYLTVVEEEPLIAEAKALGIPDWAMRFVMDNVLAKESVMYGKKNEWKIKPWWKVVQ